MSAAREDLAELFASIAFPEAPEERDAAEQVIRDMLPRTITTVEELQGLRSGAILLTGKTFGFHPQTVRHSGIWPDMSICWDVMGTSETANTDEITLPATVLYEPAP